MVPMHSRRALPTHLMPDELTDAQRRLQTMRTQAWTFWVMWVPATVMIATVAGVIGMGFFGQAAVFFAALIALAVGRMVWWQQQGPDRSQARQDINRWRRLPSDQRWDAAIVLLDRVIRLSESDPALIDTAQRMVSMLFSLYEDIRGLDQTVAADRVLEGEGELSERYHRLVAIRTRREAEIDMLLNGLRDLHLEMSEQPHIGPLQERLTEMMDRLEADREVARVAGFRSKVVDDARRRAQAQAQAKAQQRAKH